MKKQKSSIFVNGKIFTSDDANPYADAMIVEDGTIAWIGKQQDMPQKSYASVNLGGKRVLPGFVDAHMHPLLLAEYNKQISCLPPKINSIAELIKEIRYVRSQQEPGQWIQGWGYDEGKLAERRSPNRYDLDKGCADSPISITRTCAHIRCINSKALEMAGIDRNTPDPPGGEIDRDENGEPTGILRENAKNLVADILPKTTHESMLEELIEMGNILASQGITALCDMGCLEKETDRYDDYVEASSKGFRQKVGIYYMWEHFVHDADFNIPANRFSRENQIRAAGLKLIGDGSVSGKTAWMNRPYISTQDGYGMWVCPDELLESAIAFCKKSRCQLSVHAMGAKAIHRIVQRVCEETPWMEGKAPFLRVEHVTDPMEEDLDKAIEKGFGFATQPIFLYAEAESYRSNLGAEWMKATYPVKHMLEKGVKLCFSTDAPATSWAMPSDPFPCIKGAVTRKAYDGTDCGAAQRVDIETAIKLYTRESADIGGFEKAGQLKKGYAADFIVLDRDILSVPADEIDRVSVAETYISGEKIYEK